MAKVVRAQAPYEVRALTHKFAELSFAKAKGRLQICFPCSQDAGSLVFTHHPSCLPEVLEYFKEHFWMYSLQIENRFWPGKPPKRISIKELSQLSRLRFGEQIRLNLTKSPIVRKPYNCQDMTIMVLPEERPMYLN